MNGLRRGGNGAYLNHSCLSHTGFSNENGVVLRPPTENANDSTNFVVTTNDRVDLSIRGKGCQIDCILGQGVEALFGILCVHPTISADLIDGSLEDGFGKTGLFYNGLNTGIFNESEEEMVLSDVGVVHSLLNGLGLFEDSDSCSTQGSLFWGRRLRG